MISESCSFNDFVEAVRGREFNELLCLTDQEATKAERLLLRSNRLKGIDSIAYSRYAEKLKGFILFLRHGIKMSCIKDVDLASFDRKGPAERNA